MKTRTLILLAVACGVAILAAGIAFFVRGVPNVDVKSTDESQAVGGVTATVTGATTDAGLLVVSVRLAPAQTLADAGQGWSLYVAGDRAPRSVVVPATPTADDCAGQAVAAGGSLDCRVTFADGSGDHYVSYAYGGVERRWKL